MINSTRERLLKFGFPMGLLLLKSLFVAAMVLGFCACQDSENPADFDSLSDELERTVQSAKEHLDRVLPQKEDVERRATSETEKLFTFEYHAEEFDRESKAAHIKARLNALGKERWDCFHVESRKETLLVLCKRQPKTYLKYIPRVF